MTTHATATPALNGRKIDARWPAIKSPIARVARLPPPAVNASKALNGFGAAGVLSTVLWLGTVRERPLLHRVVRATKDSLGKTRVVFITEEWTVLICHFQLEEFHRMVLVNVWFGPFGGLMLVFGFLIAQRYQTVISFRFQYLVSARKVISGKMILVCSIALGQLQPMAIPHPPQAISAFKGIFGIANKILVWSIVQGYKEPLESAHQQPPAHVLTVITGWTINALPFCVFKDGSGVVNPSLARLTARSLRRPLERCSGPATANVFPATSGWMRSVLSTVLGWLIARERGRGMGAVSVWVGLFGIMIAVLSNPSRPNNTEDTTDIRTRKISKRAWMIRTIIINAQQDTRLWMG